MRSWWFPHDLDPWDAPGFDASVPEVIEVDNPVVGVLFGPDGEQPLLVIHERPTVPFGFQPPPRRDGP